MKYEFPPVLPCKGVAVSEQRCVIGLWILTNCSWDIHLPHLYLIKPLLRPPTAPPSPKLTSNRNDSLWGFDVNVIGCSGLHLNSSFVSRRLLRECMNMCITLLCENNLFPTYGCVRLGKQVCQKQMWGVDMSLATSGMWPMGCHKTEWTHKNSQMFFSSTNPHFSATVRYLKMTRL